MNKFNLFKIGQILGLNDYLLRCDATHAFSHNNRINKVTSMLYVHIFVL